MEIGTFLPQSQTYPLATATAEKCQLQTSRWRRAAARLLGGDRKLVIVDSEAPNAELGSVRLLKDEFEACGAKRK
jgi:hypothetical protein